MCRVRLVTDDVLRMEFAANLFERAAKRGIMKSSIVITSCRGSRDLQLVIFQFVCASLRASQIAGVITSKNVCPI